MSEVPRMDWYDALTKPAWTPGPAFIGTVWTVLYPIILVVFSIAVVRVVSGAWPRSLVLPLAINAVANVAFTPIQFGLRNLPLASLDIVIVLVTCVWLIVALWPHSRLASLALVPYATWVAVASTAQFSITWLNR